VVWCGVVWCGVVWCGVVWCGVVWCGVVWCGVGWGGVGWGGVMQPDAARCHSPRTMMKGAKKSFRCWISADVIMRSSITVMLDTTSSRKLTSSVSCVRGSLPLLIACTCGQMGQPGSLVRCLVADACICEVAAMCTLLCIAPTASTADQAVQSVARPNIYSCSSGPLMPDTAGCTCIRARHHPPEVFATHHLQQHALQQQVQHAWASQAPRQPYTGTSKQHNAAAPPTICNSRSIASSHVSSSKPAAGSFCFQPCSRSANLKQQQRLQCQATAMVLPGSPSLCVWHVHRVWSLAPAWTAAGA
jgi:hypothetical protein